MKNGTVRANVAMLVMYWFKAVIYLITEPMVTDARFQSDRDFEEIEGWAATVDKIKEILTSRGKLVEYRV